VGVVVVFVVVAAAVVVVVTLAVVAVLGAAISAEETVGEAQLLWHFRKLYDQLEVQKEPHWDQSLNVSFLVLLSVPPGHDKKCY